MRATAIWVGAAVVAAFGTALLTAGFGTAAAETCSVTVVVEPDRSHATRGAAAAALVSSYAIADDGAEAFERRADTAIAEALSAASVLIENTPADQARLIEQQQYGAATFEFEPLHEGWILSQFTVPLSYDVCGDILARKSAR